MLYFSHGVELGQVVWGWIRPENQYEYIPAQIKFIGLLPYQGFQYIYPDQSWKIVKDDDYGEYLKVEGGRNDSKHDAIFADSRNELIDEKIRRINRHIKDLQVDIKKLEELKNG